MSFHKKSLRNALRDSLRSISLEERWEQSLALCEHLANWIRRECPSAQLLATYSALPTEVDLSELHDLLPKVSFAYPLLQEDQSLSFHLVSDPSTLRVGSFQIQEPDPQQHPPILPENFDLILCPGLAFDPENGHRLGKGLGCYDKFLASYPKIPKIGVAFREQLSPLPSPESHDIPMTDLATPSGLIKI